MSRPARGAWVEISYTCDICGATESRPARGAWVEIDLSAGKNVIYDVAPRKGRVG